MATKIEGLEEWVIDSAESNQKLIQPLIDSGGTQENLMLSRFMPLTDPVTKITYPDTKAFDFTNKALTGGGELKSFADQVGSLTGEAVKKEKKLEGQLNCPNCGKPYAIFLDPAIENPDLNNVTMGCTDCGIHAVGPVQYKLKYTVNEGLYHLWKQVIKMYATGLPWCIIIYGDRWQYQKKSGVGDGLILQAILKLVTLCTAYKGTLYQVKNEEETVEAMKTFLRKSPELPRRWPIYNLFKKIEDDQVAMHCGIEGFGIEIARAIASKYTPAEIGHDAFTLDEDAFIKKYGQNKDSKVDLIGKTKAGVLYKAYTSKWSED